MDSVTSNYFLIMDSKYLESTVRPYITVASPVSYMQQSELQNCILYFPNFVSKTNFHQASHVAAIKIRITGNTRISIEL
jgi:hypothetical protein